MEGGQLSANMTMDGDTLDGNLEIRDFVLRDEPAIRSLVARSTTISAPGQDETPRQAHQRRRRCSSTASRSTSSAIGSRLDLSDATMYGPEIGLSVDGWLDYSHNKVAMNGTFVPVFALNNLFSQIPVIGAVLGGKSKRGPARDHLQDLGRGRLADADDQPAVGGDARASCATSSADLDLPGMQIPAGGGVETPSR